MKRVNNTDRCDYMFLKKIHTWFGLEIVKNVNVTFPKPH